ncbi:Xylose isomerase [compost metagenome]
MDTFARALLIADNILKNSEYHKLRAERYASYDSGKGKAFEEGDLSLEALRDYALANGEPKTISGRQEYLENLINRYI